MMTLEKAIDKIQDETLNMLNKTRNEEISRYIELWETKYRKQVKGEE